MTSQVTSADGTTIAFDRFGDGPPLIVIGGATCDRARTRPTAEALAAHFTVLNHDRRGRGDSGDTWPYALAREIEDLAALIAVAGGPAALYGHSSGAALALHAAAAGLSVTGLVLHEPPYTEDSEEERRAAREYAAELDALLAAGRNADALALFFGVVGMPAEMIAGMRDWPGWPELEALAPTLAYDSAALGHAERGGTAPLDVAARVPAPALVLAGGASPPWMIETAAALADAMPQGRHAVLEGQEHVVDPALLAPVVAEFLSPTASSRPRG